MISIRAHGNRLALPMVHHMMVHPALRYLSSERGLLLLHASAVSTGDLSLVLTGSGGAGKTTTSSLLLAHGQREWAPHADDYAFLAPGSQTLAYGSRCHLYRDLLRWLPSLGTRLTAWERIRLSAFGRLREISGERIKWPVRVPPERLWPGRNVRTRAALGAVVLLNRVDHEGLQVCRTEAGAETVEALLAMNFSEARHFIELVENAPTPPENARWLSSWRSRERSLLEARLAESRVHRLDLPRRAAPNPQLGRLVVRALERIVDEIRLAGDA
jgi:hypothetical protein